jgi:isoamylase
VIAGGDEAVQERAMDRIEVREGLPRPMGASWNGNGEGVNFALFSAHATRVELCLYEPTGRQTARVDLPEYTNQVWHGYVAGLAPGTLYGYRVHRPYEPDQGHRFNPNKLLLDPDARGHAGEIKWDPAIFGYQMESGDDTTFDERDSAPFMPKCVVVDPNFEWSGGHERHTVPWERRRRIRPDPARQQQCLLPGQRDFLAGLEHCRRYVPGANSAA